MIDISERGVLVNDLRTLWRECFATNIEEVKAIDLIQHSIDLKQNAEPVRGTLAKYIPQEREFANRIVSDLEDAGMVARRSSHGGLE